MSTMTHGDLKKQLQTLHIDEGSRKVLSVVANNRIPLAGLLLEHNGIMGPGAGAARKEIFTGYVEAGNHMIELVGDELYIWLSGNVLSRIASSAIFDAIIQPEQ